MLKIFPLSDQMLQLVAAAHPMNKDKYTVSQIQQLAKKMLQADSDALDSIHHEWTRFQMEDVRKLGADGISQFWYEVKELYPTLSTYNAHTTIYST